MNRKNGENTALKLTESAIMIALATILSMIKIADLPFGGSVTAASALPLLIIAYRYGTSWGILTSGVFGLIQMLLGLKNLTYATSALACILIILFDYIVAFGVMGFGGIFKGKFKNQGVEMALGSVICLVLRYLCHCVSGYAVWGSMAPEGQSALVYSVTYNATYMLPEIIITAIVAYIVCHYLDFSSFTVTRRVNKDIAVKQSVAYTITKYLSFALITIAVSILLFTIINVGMAAIKGTFNTIKLSVPKNLIYFIIFAVLGIGTAFISKRKRQ